MAEVTAALVKAGKVCQVIMKRQWRLIIACLGIAYGVLIYHLIPLMTFPLYILGMIGLIWVLTYGHLTYCDIVDVTKVLRRIWPQIVVSVMLVMLAIYFTPGTLQLLGMDTEIAPQASGDVVEVARGWWTLSYTGFQTNNAASISWMLYGPACLASGLLIAAYGDSSNRDQVQAMGTLLMFVPIVIDLITNLSGYPAGLITDMIPALDLLPKEGMFNFVRMLLNMIPDVVLISLLVGFAEQAVAERF